MKESVEFDAVHWYSRFEQGITVRTLLRCGDVEVLADSKIDTGSSFCIFERHLGESLGLNIEDGLSILIGTATGAFLAYGHEVEMETLGINVVSTVYFAESEFFDRNVLGRIGWLDRVKLGLIDSGSLLYLSPYS